MSSQPSSSAATPATATTTHAAARSSNHNANYPVEEDIQFCRSWIKISTDPVIGTGQRIAELWRLTKRDFDDARSGLPGFIGRRRRQARFGNIHRIVSKYYGHLSQVMLLNTSGANVTDQATRANEFYHENTAPRRRHNAAPDEPTDDGDNANKDQGRNSDDGANPDIGATAICHPHRKQQKEKNRADAIDKRSNEEMNAAPIASFVEWKNTSAKRSQLLETRLKDVTMGRDVSLITDADKLAYIKYRSARIMAVMRRETAVMEAAALAATEGEPDDVPDATQVDITDDYDLQREPRERMQNDELKVKRKVKQFN
ncbi:hypothetical protein MBANPS3_012394 [Mucor bainieri]